jgi:hypothetical protein
MSNNYDAHGGREDGRHSRDLGASRSVPSSVPDREVPLGLTRTPPAIHQWLDGDVAETAVRRADTARHVDFWKRLDAEATVRREMRTPPHVLTNIMAALPEGRPETTKWYQRRIELTPAALAAVAAGLLGAGLVFGMFAR